MRIGIVTQPLSLNYGGILQNYALHQVLRQLGHEPYTFDLESLLQHSYYDYLAVNTKAIFREWLGKPAPRLMSPCLLKRRERPLRRFVKGQISLIEPRSKLLDASKIESYRLEALIVGSDQVWRPKYNAHIEDMYLAFAQGFKGKKLAYAASFGTDTWEYTPAETAACRQLIQQFDAVSLREDSGVTLCREHFGLEACQVLDPTLLLTADDYNRLLGTLPASGQPYIFAYLLDPSERRLALARDLAHRLSLPLVVKGADTDLRQDDSVEKWLAQFRDAAYILTDSFHGTVFSAVYRKPFLTLGNEARGLSRLESLLSLLGLEERQLTDADLAAASAAGAADTAHLQLSVQPDWTAVTQKLSLWQERSWQFLREQL